MGSVVGMMRRPLGTSEQIPTQHDEQVVAKLFHTEYLYRISTDELARLDHGYSMDAVQRIASIRHQSLLAIYIAAPIIDNYLIVSPRRTTTLLAAVTRQDLSSRQKVQLLIQALRGLSALHRAGVVHRDFTIRNILVDHTYQNAFLFDYDISLFLNDVAGRTYRTHYGGRIFGSPGYSVPPEAVDPTLIDCPLTSKLDIYAIGGAIFSLFTDQLPSGPSADMWSLLAKIAEGIVHNGQSSVHYPNVVPRVLRPIIEACLEHDPKDRTGSVSSIIDGLTLCVDQLQVQRESRLITLRPGATLSPEQRVEIAHDSRTDITVTKTLIETVDRAVTRYGYQVTRCLGRAKGHPIFHVVPDPERIAEGECPDSNPFPKIVTAQDLSTTEDPQRVLDLWFGHYLRVLYAVRQGLLTTLYRAVYDENTSQLLLFSEFVDDARFGTDLPNHKLTWVEALGLGYLVAGQIARLHQHGMAHNNVCPASLVLKADPESRQVLPAMAGLVEPSLGPTAIEADIRQLVAMLLDWTLPGRISPLESRLQPNMKATRDAFTEMTSADSAPKISTLMGTLAAGLAILDHNFHVLSSHRGDVKAYLLLMIGPRLFQRLWPSPGPSQLSEN